MLIKSFRTAFVMIVWGLLCAGAQVPQLQPYRWKSVQILGGGFVDGVVFHPHADGVRYARADMGARIDGMMRRVSRLADALGPTT